MAITRDPLTSFIVLLCLISRYCTTKIVILLLILVNLFSFTAQAKLHTGHSVDLGGEAYSVVELLAETGEGQVFRVINNKTGVEFVLKEYHYTTDHYGRYTTYFRKNRRIRLAQKYTNLKKLKQSMDNDPRPIIGLQKIIALKLEKNSLLELSPLANSSFRDRLKNKNLSNLKLKKNQGVKELELKIDTLYRLFKQSVLTVETLHTYGFLHLDIKPANFLVYEQFLQQIYLSDYGSIQRIGSKETKINTSTFFAPPELLHESSEENIVRKNLPPDISADYFSLAKTWLIIFSDLDSKFYNYWGVNNDLEVLNKRYEKYKNKHILKFKNKLPYHSWIKLNSLLTFIDAVFIEDPKQRLRNLANKKNEIFNTLPRERPLLNINKCVLLF
ncbi:MAG: protein kinase family protein [Bdellovibrionaceae bacterium]|nr:protein kinase family protein [Pseudobdellovibrionaceae bacterium]